MTDHEQNSTRHEASDVHDEFVLHYEITEDDFREKVELLTTLAPNYRRGLTVFWVMVVLNALVSIGWSLDVVRSGEDLKFWHFINMGGAVFLLLMRYVVRPARIRSIYKKSALEGREFETHLLADGIRIAGPGTDATIQWSVIEGVVEKEHHCFLVYLKVDALTIPVRAFENERQKQDCLKFIRVKVGDYPVGQSANNSKNTSPPELFD